MPSLTFKVHLDGEAFTMMARQEEGFESWLSKARYFSLWKFTGTRNGHSHAYFTRVW